MWRILLILLALATGVAPADSAELTPVESAWLKGIWPVVAFAKEQGLPLDIVVQPQPSAGVAPLALGFVDGRCKLVFSMRGNPEAQATLDRLAPELHGAALELMAAHELGHCRRYLDGAWYSVPAGFSPTAPEGLSADLLAACLDMKAARREEAYGDLVGLAWTMQRHPALYADVHAWLVKERTVDRVPGSPHDTLPWIAELGDGAGLATSPMFAAAALVWRTALPAAD